MASERYRRNNIAYLTTDDGSIVEDHAGKESIMFQTFKERMGSSAGHNMKFDLPRIIRKCEGLEALTVPFSNEEIDRVIREMPANRAPGPDGLIGVFLKRCWPIIKEDFYNLYHQFRKGDLNLEKYQWWFYYYDPKDQLPGDDQR